MLDIMNSGVQAIIVIALMAVISMIALHFLAQRSQQHSNELSQTNLYNLLSLGLQSIIGINEVRIVDESLDQPASPTTGPPK